MINKKKCTKYLLNNKAIEFSKHNFISEKLPFIECIFKRLSYKKIQIKNIFVI